MKCTLANQKEYAIAVAIKHRGPLDPIQVVVFLRRTHRWASWRELCDVVEVLKNGRTQER